MTHPQEQTNKNTPAFSHAGVTVAELQAQLEKAEAAVQAQVDRVYDMVQQSRPSSFVQVEYKKTVELMRDKYAVLLTLLQENKRSLGTAEYERRDQQLRAQFQEDVLLLAAAIDQAAQSAE